MARSRRGGGGSFGARRPAPARPAARPAASSSTPPARSASTTTPAPMQQPSSGGGMLSGIGSTIAQGMAFGTGSAIAHRAVGAVAGSMSGGGAPETGAPMQGEQQPMMDQQQPQIAGACAQDKQMFFECLQVNKGDQQACSFLYDQLQACQRNETQFG